MSSSSAMALRIPWVDRLFDRIRRPRRTPNAQLLCFWPGKFRKGQDIYSQAECLAEGALGAIYRLRHDVPESLRQDLVIRYARRQSHALDSLEAEADAYGEVGPHDNLVAFIGTVQARGEMGFVTEYVEGEDLSVVLWRLDEALQAGLLSAKAYQGTIRYLKRSILCGLRHMRRATEASENLRHVSVRLDARSMRPKLLGLGIAAAQFPVPVAIPWESAPWVPELLGRDPGTGSWEEQVESRSSLPPRIISDRSSRKTLRRIERKAVRALALSTNG